MERRLGLAAGAALLLGAHAAWAVPQDIAISQPWMRYVTSATPAAGYFTLTNRGGQEAVLSGASSPACKKLMLHQSMQMNGADQMRMVMSVAVPPHGSVTFRPGGYHLMCMSPAPAIAPGASVPVTLRFEDGSTLTANFPVRGANGK